MPVFAPVYKQRKHPHAFLAEPQKAQKRKRDAGSDGDDAESAAETALEDDSDLPGTPQTATSLIHPVSKTDPYHVAGYAREYALPPPPFPHAAVDQPATPALPLVDELARLKPPLFVSGKATDDEHATSLKRRHLDNLTTILHRCMLKGDWARAHRAWSLLLRTEIAGRAIDLRNNGTWGIGAEILMHSPASSTVDARAVDAGHGPTDEGFRLARQYYERLILQYPHTPHSRHHVNASVIYPALFNIWIYQVQRRAIQRGDVPHNDRPRTANSTNTDDSAPLSELSGRTADIVTSKRAELAEAMAIAQRMDELMQSPPFDSNPALLELRGMVALWLSDLHTSVSESISSSEESNASPGLSGHMKSDEHRRAAEAERAKGRRLLEQLRVAGTVFPEEIETWLDGDVAVEALHGDQGR